MPLPRVIEPEILDHLAPSDPAAMRSRRDLERLDVYLGNSRWIGRMLADHPGRRRGGVVELGAGDGQLCNKILQSSLGTKVTGFDLVSRPPKLSRGVQWKSGDFFQTLPSTPASAVVGSLILHHFSAAELRDLGKLLGAAELLCFVEPYRHPAVLAMSSLAKPFVGHVTRHDMPASIRAGFLPGEIAAALALDTTLWHVVESCHWRGAIRMVAWRKCESPSRSSAAA